MGSMSSPARYKDTAVAALDVMAGLGTSPSAVANQHATDDVSDIGGHKKGQQEQQHEPKLNVNEENREKAARLIQRSYRGYRTRRELRGLGIDASTRWLEAIKEAQWRQSTRPQLPPAEGGQPALPANNTASPQARLTWKRVSNIARRAGGDDNVRDEVAASEAEDGNPRSEPSSAVETQTTASSSLQREKTAKMMDLQYFLEMVDTKHRYGSNLRTYHNYWKNTPSKQNFFYWLDYGDGKDVELPQCPRDRLEREQVRYLSREERMNYLITVDEAGRFRWAKTGKRVSTDSDRFKDSLKGVVPVEDTTPRFKGNSPEGNVIAEESSWSSSDDEDGNSSDEAKHYLNNDLNEAKGVKKLAYVSPAVIFNHLMRKSLKKRDKWIFVADTSFRLYVGIKESGAFQHSSFLRGARISAAGLIKIKDGQLRSLSPLSGHYRPPAANFRAFVHALENQGVDMSRVSISKSYAVLVGIEGYAKTKKGRKRIHEAIDGAKAKRAGEESQKSHQEDPVQSHDQEGGQEQHSGGLTGRLKSILGRGHQDTKEMPIRVKGRGIPGTAPEEGVPPPEGKR